MSFRTTLAFFKPQKMKFITWKQNFLSFTIQPFKSQEKHTQTTLLNSVISVRKLQRSLQPFLPDHSLFTASDFMICKRIPCEPSLRQTPEGGWRKLFFLQHSFSWCFAKSGITKNITGVWQVSSHLAKNMEQNHPVTRLRRPREASVLIPLFSSPKASHWKLPTRNHFPYHHFQNIF